MRATGRPRRDVLIDTVELDGSENRMWSDGPGKATLLVARDLAGNATATPIPLELTWQGGLKFDGQTIYFERDVTVAGMDGEVALRPALGEVGRADSVWAESRSIEHQLERDRVSRPGDDRERARATPRA